MHAFRMSDACGTNIYSNLFQPQGNSALLGDHWKHEGHFSVSHCRAFIMFLLFQFNQKEAWRKNIIQFFSHFTLSVNLEDYESCRGDDNIENVVTALQN